MSAHVINASQFGRTDTRGEVPGENVHSVHLGTLLPRQRQVFGKPEELLSFAILYPLATNKVEAFVEKLLSQQASYYEQKNKQKPIFKKPL